MPGHRAAKYREWTEENMGKAYHAVTEEGMATSNAAKLYNVPRRSLGDRVNRKVALGAGMGASTKLPAALEKRILTRMELMSLIGTPLTISQILLYAHTLDKERGENKFGPNGPSYNWWLRFRNANPEATKKIKRPIQPSMPTDTTLVPESSVDWLREYFTRLKGMLEQYDLMDQPERIYFCDEAVVDLSRSARPVVKSFRHVRLAAREQHVAMVSCVSAAGAVMPPYIIFKGEFPAGDYSTGGPDGCLYAKSEDGFLDTPSIEHWFQKLFLKHCRQDRDINNLVILIMDGPLSLFDPPFLLKAIEANVIFIEQVPRAANLELPLDIHVYKSMEAYIGTFVRYMYGQALQSPGWMQEFPRLLKTPWEKTMSLYNVKEGFRQCGIYPFNPNAVDKERLLQSGQITDIDVDLTALPVYKHVTSQDGDNTCVASDRAEDQEAVHAIIIDQDRTAGNNVVIVTAADCIPVEQEVETTTRTPTKQKRSAKSPSRARGRKQRKKMTRKKTTWKHNTEKETESSEDDEDNDDSDSSDDD